MSRKPAEAAPALVKVAKESKNRVARLHAIWGLSAFLHQPDARQCYVALAADPDVEIRANVAKFTDFKGRVGFRDGPDASFTALQGAIKKMLTDSESRVQALAAISY